MNSVLLVLVVAGQSAGSVPFAKMPVERVIRIDIPNHDAVYFIQNQLPLAIIDARARYITAYADDEKIARIRALGYPVTVLVEDYEKPAGLLPAVYTTYTQVCSTMQFYAAAYPAITRLETLGISVQGRAILIMKITNNPGVEANKPRIRVNGPHHGNEKIATEITLSLLKYVCDNYATNPGVQALVNTREVWIDPIFNVDGHAWSTAGRRTNANGVDLNRDYGYMWGGMSDSSPAPLSQPETRAMRENAEKHQFSLEYSYHSNASYVNYLWDNHPADPPDSAWLLTLSQRYADSTYGTDTQLSSINGFDWYEVDGSCQDYLFGIYGGLGWTIETDLPSDRPTVDSICLANRRALLDMIHLAGWGISGLVHDSASGAPLFARVEFLNPSRWQTYTQPQVGDFHKMLPPGSYSVRVSANGYVPMTISNVVVPETGAVSLDFPLVQQSGSSPYYVQRAVIVRRYDRTYSYSDWVTRAYGPPDGSSYSLGSSTARPNYVVFDVDPHLPVRNQSGNDITVYATNSYKLYASNDWTGTWSLLGSGNGQASFDLAATGMDSARYLKLVSADSAKLDAISYTGGPLVGSPTPRTGQAVTTFGVEPNPVTNRAVIRIGAAPGMNADVRVINVTGRTVRALAQRLPLSGNVRLTWDLRADDNRDVPSGVYFCRVTTGGGTLLRKVVVER